ncbi:MAG: response regulator [Candidatus Acidiferrales bacterium]
MPIDVLLVEDNAGDARLTEEVFRSTSQPVHLHVVSDGAEAMAFLRREGEYLYAPRPDLILLDLNLPKMHGHEVLAQVKSNAELNTIPIIVLTTSDSDGDVAKSYQLQANCYITKPGQWDAFEIVVKTIHDFWLRAARLPKQGAGGLKHAGDKSDFQKFLTVRDKVRDDREN